MSRGIKQFLYGFLYLAVLGIVVVFFYFVLRPAGTCLDNKQNQNETGIDCGGVCTPCEIKNLKPLTASAGVIFRNGSKISAMAELKNLNSTYGSDEVKYRVDFYDANGSIVKTISNYDFIYSNDKKYLVEAGVDDSGKIINRAVFTIEENNWKPVNEWRPPITEITNLKTVKQNDVYVVSGRVKNPNNFVISRIVIAAVLGNDFGVKAGVSKTEMENLAPFQEKDFQVFIAPDSFLADKIDINATEVVIDGIK